MTYIVSFIYNKRFNFYNVEEAQDGQIQDELKNLENDNNLASPNIQVEDID